jgi:hypothetical protein
MKVPDSEEPALPGDSALLEETASRGGTRGSPKPSRPAIRRNASVLGLASPSGSMAGSFQVT